MTARQAFDVTESAAASLPLTREQATALRAIGRRLTGANQNPDDSEKTLIECSSTDGVSWRVRVVNAVGVVGLPGGIRITVRPKIPMDHLMFLLGLGGAVPRTTPSTVRVSKSPDFHDLIAAWYVDALETLIRGGLRRAYVPQEAKLPVVRGRIDAHRTTIDLIRGNLQLSCEFEELTEDTSLNRVLAAAARRIARSRLMSLDLRRRARGASYYLSDLSPMRPEDLRVDPDRIAARYVDAISLAHLLLAGAGVSLEDGHNQGSSFLLPTPLVVEAALRMLVAEALDPLISVTKGRLSLRGTKMTVNPDLDFGRLAIGDVKYKVWDGSWNRNDLYQLIAFAAAYERKTALHVGFGGSTPDLPLRVGKVDVWRVPWNIDSDIPPEEAAAAFQQQVLQWWDAVEAGSLQSDWEPTSLPWTPDLGR